MIFCREQESINIIFNNIVGLLLCWKDDKDLWLEIYCSYNRHNVIIDSEGYGGLIRKDKTFDETQIYNHE